MSPPSEKAIDAQLPSQPTQQAMRLPEKAKQNNLEAKQSLRESTSKITTEVINSKEAASFEELDEASEDLELAPDDTLFAQLQTLFPGQILEIEELQKEEAEELIELPLEVEPEFEA